MSFAAVPPFVVERHEITRFFATLYKDLSGVLQLRTFGPEGDSETAKKLRREANRLRDFVPVKNGVVDESRVLRFIEGCNKAHLGAFFGVALRSQASLKDRKGRRSALSDIAIAVRRRRLSPPRGRRDETTYCRLSLTTVDDCRERRRAPCLLDTDTAVLSEKGNASSEAPGCGMWPRPSQTSSTSPCLNRRACCVFRAATTSRRSTGSLVS